MDVKRSKELDDNIPTKHDRIARLIKDGRFSYPRILKDMEAELRFGSSFRSKLTEELAAVKNMMIRWLECYFPEFTQVFPSFGKMAMAVLECTPFPNDLHQKHPDEVLSLYRKVEGLKSPQRPKAVRLIEVVANSIGVTEEREMARIEIATLVRRYHQLDQEIEDLTQHLVKLVQTSVEYEWLSTVQVLGDTKYNNC